MYVDPPPPPNQYGTQATGFVIVSQAPPRFWDAVLTMQKGRLIAAITNGTIIGLDEPDVILPSRGIEEYITPLEWATRLGDPELVSAIKARVLPPSIVDGYIDEFEVPADIGGLQPSQNQSGSSSIVDQSLDFDDGFSGGEEKDL